MRFLECPLVLGSTPESEREEEEAREERMQIPMFPSHHTHPGKGAPLRLGLSAVVRRARGLDERRLKDAPALGRRGRSWVGGKGSGKGSGREVGRGEMQGSVRKGGGRLSPRQARTFLSLVLFYSPRRPPAFIYMRVFHKKSSPFASLSQAGFRAPLHILFPAALQHCPTIQSSLLAFPRELSTSQSAPAAVMRAAEWRWVEEGSGGVWRCVRRL